MRISIKVEANGEAMDTVDYELRQRAENAHVPPLKIGYLVPEFPSQTHAFFWREVKGLRAEGIDVRLISTKAPSDPSLHDFSLLAAGETSYLFPPPMYESLKWILCWPRAALRAVRYALQLDQSTIAERVKVLALVPSAAALVRYCQSQRIAHLHVHSFANALHLAALANCMSGLRYSATLHGDLPVYGTDHAQKLRGASFATAVTRPLIDQISECAPGTETHLITMGVDVDHFRPALRGACTSGGRLHAVSIARLNRTKGHSYFLEAMASLVGSGIDLHYSIAGEGPHRVAIEADISRLKLHDRVSMLGAISEERVRELLHTSDIFILSSFGQGEAAPVAVMEAMACGVPVICSRIGGTEDMIDHGVDGLLTAQEDVQALEIAVRMLVSRPALALQLAKAARNTACRKFDYRSTAAQLACAIRQSLIV